LTAKVNCIYQLADGTMMMGSDNGLWIEPDTDVSGLIVEQQEIFIKGIYQASNGEFGLGLIREFSVMMACLELNTVFTGVITELLV